MRFLRLTMSPVMNVNTIMCMKWCFFVSDAHACRHVHVCLCVYECVCVCQACHACLCHVCINRVANCFLCLSADTMHVWGMDTLQVLLAFGKNLDAFCCVYNSLNLRVVTISDRNFAFTRPCWFLHMSVNEAEIGGGSPYWHVTWSLGKIQKIRSSVEMWYISR